MSESDSTLNDLWSSHRLGIWLFMSEMPYGTLSSSMLWKVLYVMQCAETAELETLSSACDTHSCIMGLRGISARLIPKLSLMSSENVPGAGFKPTTPASRSSVSSRLVSFLQTPSTSRGLRAGCVK